MKSEKVKEKRSGGDRRSYDYGVVIPDERKKKRRKNENKREE